MSKQYLRRCEVYDDGVVMQGLFHRWDKRPIQHYYFDRAGNECTAMMTEIVGVVELLDGSVECVPVGDIRFTDGLAEYVYSKLADKEKKDE